MKKFHVSLTQGRADTFTIEGQSSSKIINFFKSLSTAVLSSLKEIVYSKEHNINYSGNTVVVNNEESYRKVEVFARTKTYSKVFTLYHVKLSVTKDKIVNEFKKLMILDEPIIDVHEVLFFTNVEGVARTSNYEYQVAYSINSKTHHTELEAIDYLTVKGVIESLINGELIEIRHHLLKDSTTKIDDGNYIKYISCFCKNDLGEIMSFKIPKVKHSHDTNSILPFIKDSLSISGRPIKTVKTTVKI